MTDLKNVLQAIAPTIATALGGPLAGGAVKFLADKLLGDPNADEMDVLSAVQGASPETLAKIKQIDATFKIEMKKLDIDLERIAAGDRDSARERQVAMHDWTPNIMGFVVIAMWGWVQYTIITGGLPDSIDSAIVARILGMLDAAMLVVLYFFYGSSAGSKKKTDHMAGRS